MLPKIVPRMMLEIPNKTKPSTRQRMAFIEYKKGTADREMVKFSKDANCIWRMKRKLNYKSYNVVFSLGSIRASTIVT